MFIVNFFKKILDIMTVNKSVDVFGEDIFKNRMSYDMLIF